MENFEDSMYNLQRMSGPRIRQGFFEYFQYNNQIKSNQIFVSSDICNLEQGPNTPKYREKNQGFLN